MYIHESSKSKIDRPYFLRIFKELTFHFKTKESTSIDLNCQFRCKDNKMTVIVFKSISYFTNTYRIIGIIIFYFGGYKISYNAYEASIKIFHSVKVVK